MNTVTIFLVLCISCSVSYGRSTRHKRFVPNFYGPYYSDAMQDFIGDYLRMRYRYPWMFQRNQAQANPSVNPYQGQGQGPPPNQAPTTAVQTPTPQVQQYQVPPQTQNQQNTPNFPYPTQTQNQQNTPNFPYPTQTQNQQNNANYPYPSATPNQQNNVEAQRLLLQSMGILPPPRLWPGQIINDPIMGRSMVAGADGTDRQMIAADGSVITVDGTDYSRSGGLPPFGFNMAG